ncbi:MAG: acetyl-CoA carboxylase biotin carboxyl carrier protein subunit [Bacteroidota bacterium]|nr:acetyl-CoA carboxylase biotin carboxyl carrier protein subunit [Bacteroidota bacterium]
MRRNTVSHHFKIAFTMENSKSKDKYQYINIDNIKYKTHLTQKFIRRNIYEEKDPRKVLAFIPGTIKKVFVTQGKKIKEGDKILILEAMKMNNIITSPQGGTVKEVTAKQGKIVAKNELLIEIE